MLHILVVPGSVKWHTSAADVNFPREEMARASARLVDDKLLVWMTRSSISALAALHLGLGVLLPSSSGNAGISAKTGAEVLAKLCM